MTDEAKPEIVGVKAWLCPGCDLIHLGMFSDGDEPVHVTGLSGQTAEELGKLLIKLSSGRREH